MGAALDYVEKLGIEKIAAYEHELLLHGTEVLSKIPGVRIIGTAENKAAVLSFVVTSHSFGAQVAMLSATFLLLAVMVDCGWAVAAGRARGLLAVHGRLRNRISGGLLVGAGIGLAFARKS